MIVSIVLLVHLESDLNLFGLNVSFMYESIIDACDWLIRSSKVL